MKTLLMVAALVLAAAGCSTTNPDVVGRDEAQRQATEVGRRRAK